MLPRGLKHFSENFYSVYKVIIINKIFWGGSELATPTF